MKKEVIVRTAVCRFSKEDDCFVVESPLYELVAGIGETQKEAWKVFGELLDDMFEAHEAGRLHDYSKPGRPQKGIVSVGYQVTPEIKEAIRSGAGELGISQGEYISFAVRAAESFLIERRDYSINYLLANIGDKQNQSKGVRKSANAVISADKNKSSRKSRTPMVAEDGVRSKKGYK